MPGKTVFVGNIPYGVSEEQIKDIFSRVGAVNGFRLVHDKDTGRPKGFGFLEYTDGDAAAAAVRNLNEFEIMGRKLRVDWSNDSSGGAQAADDIEPTAVIQLPPLPIGTEITPNITAPDAISQTLAAMPAPALLDLISQTKSMAAENPALVTQLFAVRPQFAYAIFQALLLLGLTDMNVLSSIVQATAAATQPQPPRPMPPQQQQQPPPQPQYVQAPPPISNPYAPYPQYQQMHMPTPPVQQNASYLQPPPIQPPVPAPAPAGDQAALVQQLLAMTAEQIYGLPPPQRDQILQLRAQLGAPVS